MATSRKKAANRSKKAMVILPPVSTARVTAGRDGWAMITQNLPTGNVVHAVNMSKYDRFSSVFVRGQNNYTLVAFRTGQTTNPEVLASSLSLLDVTQVVTDLMNAAGS